jgi:hypothetical protein
VFIGRSFDARAEAPIESVQIYLQRGSEEGDGMAVANRTELKIIVRKSGGASDDDLDQIAKTVDAALLADMSLGGIANGIVYEALNISTTKQLLNTRRYLSIIS